VNIRGQLKMGSPVVGELGGDLTTTSMSERHVTNSTEQSPSSEANSSSTTPEICIFWDPKFRPTTCPNLQLD
jgi:hypothetical protein